MTVRPRQVPSALTVPAAASAITVTTVANPTRWMAGLIPVSLRRGPVVLGDPVLMSLLMPSHAVLFHPPDVLVVDSLDGALCLAPPDGREVVQEIVNRVTVPEVAE